MLPLKLTLSASIYGHPYKWVRTLPATVATGSLIATSRASNSSPFMSISPTERVYPMRRSAPVVSSSQHPYAKVGLKSGRRPFTSLYTSKSSSSGDKGGEAAGSSESSDVEEDLILESSQDRDGESYNQKQLQEKQIGNQQNLKLLTLPTALTLGRVAAVPLIICTFYVNSWWGITATTSIFIAAAITDWLDGYIARKMQLGTAFGAFLDPVADKLMVAATLVLLCTRALSADVFRQVPWLLTVPSIVIIGREITMSAVREWAASRNSEFLEAVAVNNLGKWKTATQMIALTLLLATRDSSLAEHGVLVASGVVLLYISAGLAVWSLVVYMRKIWRILLK